MSNILRNLFLVLFIFTGVVYGKETNQQNDTDEAKIYRRAITFKYTRLFNVTQKYGEVLISGDFNNILSAATSVIDALEKMKYELEAMDVPEQMVEPYHAFLDSIKAYRQSADNMRIAMGILLGKLDGTGIEVEESIDKSENYVEIANKYLGLSIVLHEEIFRVDKGSQGKCKKYLGSLLNWGSKEVIPNEAVKF
ncbi:MAG: hypothetical protein WBD99_04210 [Thermodesulfobacteriota bacterium]